MFCLQYWMMDKVLKPSDATDCCKTITCWETGSSPFCLWHTSYGYAWPVLDLRQTIVPCRNFLFQIFNKCRFIGNHEDLNIHKHKNKSHFCSLSVMFQNCCVLYSYRYPSAYDTVVFLRKSDVNCWNWKWLWQISLSTPPLLVSQQAVHIRANAFNWNRSKLAEPIKMKSHFSNLHIMR